MADMSVDVLPVDCLSKIISLTSPRDACRLSVVSRLFNSAADSDAVWDTFLPSDYKDIVSNSPSSDVLTSSSSKKSLYFHLCCKPIILNNGTMSFSLEKESGKKCYMVAPRQLTIRWLCRDKPQWWNWQSMPESRFDEVVELLMHVWWLDVRGKIETKILSPRTSYATYFVFKLSKSGNEYERIALQLGAYFEGRDNGKRRVMFLNPSTNAPQLCRDRGDGWMEIEMSEFFNANGNEGTLLFRIFDFQGFCTKHGLIIEGIELRPKLVDKVNYMS